MKTTEKHDVSEVHEPSKHTFTGNILLFYAFDIGDEIDLNEIKKSELLPTRAVSLSPYFKNYHIPLAFRMPLEATEDAKTESDCILSRIHHFGVLSFCYCVPFEATFDVLGRTIIEMDERYNRKSERDAKEVFDKILRTIRKPRFYHLKKEYFVIHVNPLKERISPEDFKDLYGSKIATMLRLETQKLSDYQRDEILASTTGYYGQDFIIIDSQASFVYDDEYFETIEFFESANIQQLELQYFDRLLYKQLNYFYSEGSFKIPLKAYMPLIGRTVELPITRLSKLRVDISVITEQLENSISMAGEAYYSKLYAMLVEKLSIPAWKVSINKKLSIIHDIYSIYQDHLDAIHEEILTVVIIILIAIEAFGTFAK